MRIATLGIISQNGKVLLGLKKTGEIGKGTLNSPGGKCEPGETPPQCLIREVREELGIELFEKHLQEVAILIFHVAHVPDFKVHVFRTSNFEGVPKETESMSPQWHPIEDIPFEKMLESDRQWFKKAILGETFRAHVYYKRRAEGFDHIKFFRY